MAKKKILGAKIKEALDMALFEIPGLPRDWDRAYD